MKRISTIIAFLLYVFCNAHSQTISVADAMKKAMSLKVANNVSNSTNQPQLAYTSTKNSNTLYYVFDYPDGGFAIIGGDEKAKEVLGFCEYGSFNIDSIPDGLKFMLSCYEEQISAAISSNSTAINDVVTSTTSKTDVAQMLSTTWNQDEPYNCKIPSLGSSYTGIWGLATGCGPTAAAQIMKYWNYPKHGSGSQSYTKNWISGSDTITYTYEADFANTTYDWDNMIDNYSGSYTSTQADAVGTLMYHVGVAMHANYGQICSNGTSTYNFMVRPAFTTYFGYDTNASMKSRSSYSDEEWEELIYSELKAGRPLFYRGQSDNGGHAFVCDGYEASSGNYHFNWGWGSYCNGWYPLTGTGALKPNGSGIGGAGGNAAYTGSQTALIGLQPATNVVSVTGITLSSSSLSLTAGNTSQLTATVSPSNATNKSVTWTSSNTSVAKVSSSGLVTAVAAGNATITCNAADGSGVQSCCYVVVSKPSKNTDPANYDNVVYIESSEALCGTEATLSMQMKNSIPITGFQCDVYAPSGTSVAKDDDDMYLIELSETRTTAKKTNYFDSALQKDGAVRIMCSSTKSYTFSGNEGEVATIKLNIDENLADGDYPLTLKNIVLSDADAKTYKVDSVKTTLKVYSCILGDANADKKVNVDDCTTIVNYILGNNPLPFIAKAADINADGEINVVDLAGVVSIIRHGTSSAKTKTFSNGCQY